MVGGRLEMGDRRQETEGRRQEKGDGRQETGDRRCMGDRRWERVLCHTVLRSRSLDILVGSGAGVKARLRLHLK